MSENNESLFAGAAVEPGQGSSVESVKPSEVVDALGEPTPQFLTKDEFLAYQKDVADKITASERKAQGMVDKNVNRLEQELYKIKEPLARAGMTLTPEQENALRAQVMYDQVAQLSSYQQAPAPVRPVEKTDPTTVKAQGILEAYGLDKVDKNSPNFKYIDTETNDPKKFLQTMKAYAEAEAKSREPQPNTSPQAQLPATSGGTTDLMSEYQAELKKIPRGSAYSINRIRLADKYRKQGLSV